MIEEDNAVAPVGIGVDAKDYEEAFELLEVALLKGPLRCLKDGMVAIASCHEFKLMTFLTDGRGLPRIAVFEHLVTGNRVFLFMGRASIGYTMICFEKGDLFVPLDRGGHHDGRF